jgi:hypothetical protein
MLTIAVVLFLLAAVAGIVMATGIFKSATPRPPVATVHGLLAASALLIAVFVAFTQPSPPIVAYGAVILIVAALGGFFLLSFHVRGKAHPRAVVVLHALLAVTGVACLAVSLLH